MPKVPIEPTKDIVKESLFNILGSDIIEKSFVDLFAGSGNVGIEALSRGAASLCFVESNPIAVQGIKENLSLFQLKAHVILSDVNSYLKRYQGIASDYIFMDPPYKDFNYTKLFLTLSQSKLLSAGSFIILEHYSKQAIEIEVSHFEQVDQRTYGGTTLSFYQLN